MSRPPVSVGPQGVVLVDKPAGCTSFDVVRQVRKLFGTRSAGHTGTLDPMATGLLPICLGDATRIAGFLTGADKRYRATVRFGITTDTLDADGTVLERRDASGLTREQVASLVAGLVGEQRQAPPMFSAAKVQGRRLYELARAGETVERQARSITVHVASLVSFEAPDAVIDVHVSKGTYVRVLAESLGEATGLGAHLVALRRTASGPFTIEQAQTLGALEAMSPEGRRATLLDVESTLAHLPSLVLDPRTAASVAFGNPVPAEVAARCGGPFPAGTLVRILEPAGLVVAVGESDGAAVRLARVLRARTGPGKAGA